MTRNFAASRRQSVSDNVNGMRSATLLDLLPPPCAGDPRRARYAAKLIARSLAELEATPADSADDRRAWLAGAERLVQRIGDDESLAQEVALLRAIVSRTRAGMPHTERPD